MCEAASVDRARQLLLVTRRITRWDPAAAVVVLASGVYLGAAGWWTEGWFYLSIAAWIANLLLAVFIVDRLRAAWLLATEHPDGPELLALDAGRRSARWNGALASMGANDVAMIFLMVMKPGLSGALAFVEVERIGAAGVHRNASADATAADAGRRGVMIRPVTCSPDTG